MEDKKPSKKIIILPVICVIALAVVIFEIFYFMKQSEQKKELADLQNMQCADLTAQLALARNEITEKVTYWYDSTNFELCSLDDEKPIAYGSGTKIAGGGNMSFQKDQNISYNYDEKTNYTDKIIQVTIDPETMQITLEWVE